MVLAWVFELTPEALRKDDDLDRSCVAFRISVLQHRIHDVDKLFATEITPEIFKQDIQTDRKSVV